MKKENLTKYLFVAVFLIAIATISSCNRGIGCPGEFSLGQDVNCVDVDDVY